jgi:hypothetical protein
VLKAADQLPALDRPDGGLGLRAGGEFGSGGRAGAPAGQLAAFRENGTGQKEIAFGTTLGVYVTQ